MINTKKTIEINGAKITLKPLTGWAYKDGEMVRDALIHAVGRTEERDDKKYDVVNEIVGNRIGKFILMLLCTDEVSGGLGFDWPSTESSMDAIVEAYHAIEKNMDADELLLWIKTIEEVNTPPGDPDTAPENPTKK